LTGHFGARRLRTFQQWPRTAPVSARDLVEAGFFYVGPGDEVQCFCCGGILKDWRPGDCPLTEHVRFFPSCKYIRGEDVGNQEMLSLQEIFDTVDGQFLSVLQGIVSEETALPNEPDLIVQNILQMGFDPTWVANLVENKFVLTGAFYLSESELISDLLQSGWEVNGSQLSTEEQLRRLQEERMCKVCMDRDVSVVFVPCGHLVACEECALNLRLCPICRAVIQGSVRAFMS
uniref:RING-type E3 ubiquitin transferase n=1 Tax=Serinus canaria TaxID=9135 RepID=A0A8C9NPR8_SERCA